MSSRESVQGRGLDGRSCVAQVNCGLTEDAFVVDVQCAVGRFDEFGQQRSRPRGRIEITVGGFVVA